MREHGVLRRIMLAYDEILRRLAGRQAVPLDALATSSELIRAYIQEGHEKLEESFVFPRFEKAGKLPELVATLQTQHDSGRKIIAEVLALSKRPLRSDAERKRVGDHLRAFVRMYRAHAAWEDSVLFPALEELVGAGGYRELGEEFEKAEESLGELGFDEAMARVSKVEAALGIQDLAKFSP